MAVAVFEEALIVQAQRLESPPELQPRPREPCGDGQTHNDHNSECRRKAFALPAGAHWSIVPEAAGGVFGLAPSRTGPHSESVGLLSRWLAGKAQTAQCVGGWANATRAGRRWQITALRAQVAQEAVAGLG
jgi:hypothetical protein